MNESFTSSDDRKESFTSWRRRLTRVGSSGLPAHAELKGTLLTSDAVKVPFTASDTPKDTFSATAQRDFAGALTRPAGLGVVVTASSGFPDPGSLGVVGRLPGRRE
jgi:hypothetical protein